MSGEFLIVRWGLFEVIGSGPMAIFVAGVTVCVLALLWLHFARRTSR